MAAPSDTLVLCSHLRSALCRVRVVRGLACPATAEATDRGHLKLACLVGPLIVAGRRGGGTVLVTKSAGKAVVMASYYCPSVILICGPIVWLAGGPGGEVVVSAVCPHECIAVAATLGVHIMQSNPSRVRVPFFPPGSIGHYQNFNGILVGLVVHGCQMASLPNTNVLGGLHRQLLRVERVARRLAGTVVVVHVAGRGDMVCCLWARDLAV